MQVVPDTSRSATSAATRRAALLGGLGYVLLLLVSWYWVHGDLVGLFDALFTVQVGPWLLFAFGGGSLVGAVLAVAVVQYRLVAPVAVVLALFGVAMYEMWQAMQASYVLLPGTPYDLFLVGWPVVLGLAVAGGVVEWLVRDWRIDGGETDNGQQGRKSP